ncbi:MAG: LytTR family transcriptional regulator [Treponema sp.]|nr:LytTR family transcriptional regulator [Treponema sp.]
MIKVSLKIIPEIINTEVQILCSEESTQIKELSNTINHLINYDSIKIPCYDGFNIVTIPLNEITHFFSMDKKVYAACNQDTYEVKKRLYELEEYLTIKQFTQFIRVSKNAVVNFDYVKKIDITFKGSIFLFLNNDFKIPISRRFYSKIKDYINSTLINLENME